MAGGWLKLSRRLGGAETPLLLLQILTMFGYLLPWSPGARGFVYEMIAYAAPNGTSSLQTFSYVQTEFFLLAFIIPLVAGFASVVMLVAFIRVPGIKRRALGRAVFVLDCVVMSGPLAFLQMYAFPPGHYRVWTVAEHMAFGWYFALVCGLVASCLAAYLLQRDRNVSANRLNKARGAPSTRLRWVVSLPALYVLLIVGVLTTVLGFNQAWVSAEVRFLSYPHGVTHTSGADYAGPIILVPIAALLSLVLIAVSRISRPGIKQASVLAAQGLVILGIALAFFWWITFPRFYLMNKSTAVQYIKLEYGWFLSVGGLVLILGCLWFIDTTSTSWRSTAKEDQRGGFSPGAL
jgi:hypothetical protein